MNRHNLTTPILPEDLQSINIGDFVYITGTIYTGRDHVHLRSITHEEELPVDLQGGVLFHAGPIIREREDSCAGFEVVSVGPTTSMRMEKLEDIFISKTGIRLIIGKGGMGDKTTKACQDQGCIHAVYPGGCAVLAATQIKCVRSVNWLDLGMPEAIWEMEVDNFGPLLVSIDVHGNNLFEQQRTLYRKRQEEALNEINQYIQSNLGI